MKDQAKQSHQYKIDALEDRLNILNEPAATYGFSPVQFSPFEHLSIARSGLPIQTLSKLSSRFQWTNARLAAIFGISEKTLHNRMNKGDMLKTHESDLALSLVELYSEGIETFGDAQTLITWMNSEWEALRFSKPTEFINTVTGVNFLKEELRNIREGIFS